MHVKEGQAGPSLIHGHMRKVQSGRQRDRRSSHSVLAPSTQPRLHLLTFCAEDLGAAFTCGSAELLTREATPQQSPVGRRQRDLTWASLEARL